MGAWRVFVLIDDESSGGGCSVVEDPAGPAVGKYRFGSHDALIATVPDGIEELTATFADDTTQRLPVRDNAVFVSAPVSVEWADAGGRRHSQTVPPTRTPPGPPGARSASVRRLRPQP